MIEDSVFHTVCTQQRLLLQSGESTMDLEMLIVFFKFIHAHLLPTESIHFIKSHSSVSQAIRLGRIFQLGMHAKSLSRVRLLVT